MQPGASRDTSDWRRLRTLTAITAAVLLLITLVVAPSPSRAAGNGSVSGTVTADDVPGEGVSGITVNLTNPAGGIVASSTTGASGSWTIVAVPGNYFVQFYSPINSFSAYEGEWWNDAIDRGTAEPITLAALGTLSGIDASLARRGAITGSVSIAQPQGYFNQGHVYVWSCATGGGYGSVFVDPTQSGVPFSFTNLPPGKYGVGFSGQSDRVIGGWWQASLNRETAVPVTVTSGQTTSEINIVNQAAASLSGVLRTPLQGRELVGYVTLFDAQGRFVSQELVSGFYIFHGLREGQYYLLGESLDYLDEWWGGSLDKAGATAITVRYGQSNTADISLDPGAEISGSITRSSGAVGSTGVVAWRKTSTGQFEEVAQTYTTSGGYSLKGLRPGTYRLFAGDSGTFNSEPPPHGQPSATSVQPFFWPNASSLWQAQDIVITANTDVVVRNFALRDLTSLAAGVSPTTPPTIVGTLTPGSVLRASPGTWPVSGLTFSYQWRVGGVDVLGANSSTYTPTAADLYKIIRVVVSATKAGYPWRHVWAETDPIELATATGPFADVSDSNPFLSQINWMANAGISTGSANLPGRPLYKPSDPLSRQAFAAFLYRYSGENFQAPPYSTFSDVAEDSPFYTAIEWMAARGISTGRAVPCGAPRFSPTDNISRQAAAAFLARFARADQSPPAQNRFADVPRDARFAGAIDWMAANGVSTGSVNPAGGLPLYLPADPISRQAVAAFLGRYDALP